MDIEHGPVDRRYRLVRALARVTSGGHVWAAQHVVTRKWCAVKLLDAEAPARVRKRMRREMEVLALAQGPGVVDFRDAGEADGRLFITLELLEGRTLAGLLAAKGRLNVGQAVRITADVAAALARCHSAGIVHRDVKPANVFVTTKESVRLLDFGIAKLLDQPNQEKLTQENTIVGTPEYMAPEALLMSPDVDTRADQYGLGVLLYECLTGAVPFEGSYAEVFKKVSTSPIPPLHLARPDVPIALERVVRRALARDPEARFSTMAEMREAIQATVGDATDVSLFSDPIRGRIHDVATLADAPAARGHAGTGKRRHARAPYVALARLESANHEQIEGRIEEISESGFQFVGDRSVPDGTQVSVRFSLPVTGKLIETDATSRWNRATRGLVAAGFEFGSLPESAIGELRTYVSIMCSE